MTVGVIQARIGSTRLPGKVLLPIRGAPSVVLCARRAANLGLHVLVATSDSDADDILVATVRAHGLPVVRGPLMDVLKRFVIATENLPETALVVRLTADNLFPDGALVAELVEEIERTGKAYLETASPEDGLPYGVSVEAFKVSALREADRLAVDVLDREHVTPWIRRRFPCVQFRPRMMREDLGHLRCTIDSIEDYQCVANAFSSVDDPVSASWLELCLALERQLPRPQIAKRFHGGKRMGELVLGTAQLGLPSYGRANTTGRPERNVAADLIRTAIGHGVDCLDTARAYEQAEQVVGEAIKPFGGRIEIVTKLSALSDLPEGAAADQICAAVDASVFRSCRELGIESLPVMLLHRWAHRTSHKGMIWQRLLELRSEGVIGTLGASVSCVEEARAALNDASIKHLQVPYNLLDHRWEATGIDQLALQRADVVVHARSVLLQGILASNPEFWPRFPEVDPSIIVKLLEMLVRELGRESRVDLCLAFARAQSWIHGLVVGVETAAQLADLLQLFQHKPLKAEEREMVRRALPVAPERLLNPALWPTR